jgi:hypothetical protein
MVDGQSYCDEVIDEISGEDFLDQTNRENLDDVVEADDFDSDDEYYNEFQASGAYPAYADWDDEDFDDDYYLELDDQDEDDEDFF